MRLILISGQSGSGKSVALNMLEDLGYYCMDNIPARLLDVFIDDLVSKQEKTFALTAIGLDARSGVEDLALIPQLREKFGKSTDNFELIFLRADKQSLLSRYSETRRKHPLSRLHANLNDAIDAEKKLLTPLQESADLIIDTSKMSVHELRSKIKHRVAGDQPNQLSLEIISFAFRNGVPRDADFVFDVRCLPNPHWDERLRLLSGKDQPVIDFLRSKIEVRQMLEDLNSYFSRWLPQFQASNRSYLTIAIGCTGGRHRSVFIAESLANTLKPTFQSLGVRHKSLDQS